MIKITIIPYKKFKFFKDKIQILVLILFLLKEKKIKLFSKIVPLDLLYIEIKL